MMLKPSHCRPELPTSGGKVISSTTTSGCSCRAQLTAAAPSSAVSTVKPRFFSLSSNAFKTTGLSSTTKILRPFPMDVWVAFWADEPGNGGGVSPVKATSSGATAGGGLRQLPNSFIGDGCKFSYGCGSDSVSFQDTKPTSSDMLTKLASDPKFFIITFNWAIFTNFRCLFSIP